MVWLWQPSWIKMTPQFKQRLFLIITFCNYRINWLKSVLGYFANRPTDTFTNIEVKSHYSSDKGTFLCPFYLVTFKQLSCTWCFASVAFQQAALLIPQLPLPRNTDKNPAATNIFLRPSEGRTKETAQRSARLGSAQCWELCAAAELVVVWIPGAVRNVCLRCQPHASSMSLTFPVFNPSGICLMLSLWLNVFPGRFTGFMHNYVVRSPWFTGKFDLNYLFTESFSRKMSAGFGKNLALWYIWHMCHDVSGYIEIL